jgi:hypothetical protein
MAARIVLAMALLMLLGGLVLAVLAEPRHIGILLLGLGVAQLGVYFLLASRDRPVALVLVVVGIMATFADLLLLTLTAL